MKTIPLTNSPLLVQVDDEDYLELLLLGPWLLNSGYARQTKKPYQYLHKIISEKLNIKLQVEHRDRNGLNCTRENLRESTQAQNVRNQTKQKNTSSNYKGVYWNKEKEKWVAQIHHNNEHIFLGRYTIEKDAAIAYNKAAIKYHGEFASLNEV